MKQNLPQSKIALANSAEVPLALGNEVELDADGWGLIAPFGEWPKTRRFLKDGRPAEQKYIQVLDNQAADQLVGSEDSFFRRIKRALIGIPVYKGHGDLKDIDPAALDNTEKLKVGVIDRVRKGDKGLEAHFALDNDGAEAVAAGWKFPSALWYVLPNGQRGDAIVCRPVKLISVALTQFPNISGVESLANAGAAPAASAEPKSPVKKNMNKLTGYLIGRGITLPSGANEEQIITAIGNAMDGASASDPADETSRVAHRATAAAFQQQTPAAHLKAAHAHAEAASAQTESGDTATAQHHQASSTYHVGQAQACQKDT